MTNTLYLAIVTSVTVLFAFLVRLSFDRISRLIQSDRTAVPFRFFNEISNDVKQLGKWLAWFIVLSSPFLFYFPQFFHVCLSFLETLLIVYAAIFAVTYSNIWEQWKLSNIPLDLTPKDRQFFLTLIPLIVNSSKYLIYGSAIFFIFAVWDINLSAFFGGAAIAALVLGIGGQHIISDILTGLFIIFERNYYADSIICVFIGSTEIVGIVVKITWRNTWIQDKHRHVYIISNRTIDRVKVIQR
ncbi:mechanosensitive ion channel family protein [bacterium]|nr:mechanosensitive ion channel family protein [bacterium]